VQEPAPGVIAVVVDGVTTAVAEAIKATVTKIREPKAIDVAVDWLKSALESGPQPQKVLEAMAPEAGISARTLKRAKAKAKVVSERIGRDYWVWRLGIVKMEDGQDS
jgi:hypothetical protein